jgi:hypothetical protein
MTCSVDAEDDGDAPDRRGAYGLDGVAMLKALAYQLAWSDVRSVRVLSSTTSTNVDIG